MTRRELLALPGLALAPSTPPLPRLTGTFLQLHRGHFDWPAELWDQLFRTFAELSLSRLIVQWTRFDGVSFVPLLPGILARAGAAGIGVDLGLLHAAEFWSMAEADRPSVLAGFFEASRSLLADLTPFLADPAFRGWYVTQEFDDVRWARRSMKDKGGRYLRAVARLAREVRPGSRVAVSAFSNGVMKPRDWARLWDAALDFSGVDELLFQDGVGVRKLTIEQAEQYHRALGERLPRRVTPVVELLEMTQESPFAAVPADHRRLERQLRSAAASRSDQMVAFAVPEYLSPIGGDAARELLERYQLMHSTGTKP